MIKPPAAIPSAEAVTGRAMPWLDCGQKAGQILSCLPALSHLQKSDTSAG